jgi:hypothetical protein
MTTERPDDFALTQTDDANPSFCAANNGEC